MAFPQRHWYSDMKIKLDENYPLPPQLYEPLVLKRIMRVAYNALRNNKLSPDGDITDDVLHTAVAGLYAKMQIQDDDVDIYEACSALYNPPTVQEGDLAPCGETWSTSNNPAIVYAQVYAPRSSMAYWIELRDNGVVEAEEAYPVSGIVSYRLYSGVPSSMERAQPRVSAAGFQYLPFYNRRGYNASLDGLWDLCGYTEAPYRKPLAIQSFRVIPDRIIELGTGRSWNIPSRYRGYPAALIGYPSNTLRYQHVLNGLDGEMWAVSELVDYSTAPWLGFITIDAIEYPDEDYPLPNTDDGFEGFEIDLQAGLRVPDGLPAIPVPYTAGLARVRGASGRLYGIAKDGFAYTRSEANLEAEIRLTSWADVAVESGRALNLYYRQSDNGVWALYQEYSLVDLSIGPVTVQFEAGVDYYFAITSPTPLRAIPLKGMFRITKISIP